MKSSTGKLIITIHILPNISRGEGNQTMKFGQLIGNNIYLYLSISIYIYLYLYIYLSIYLSIYQSIYIYIYIYVYVYK